MTTFPRTTPSALDVDARGVLAFVDALESTPGVEPHSFMLLRHGQVAAGGWWQPYSADRVHLLYSLSKSFTAAAVGIAVRQGLVDLDATVLSYFPELDADVTDERSRRMRVRHLLAMASGHREETLERAEALDPTNTVRGFLLLPPDEEPGSVFAYNQPCTYTLASIVRRVTGGSLVAWLRPHLLDPLGIDDLAWRRDDTGAEFGFSGCYATTDAVAKLGQLYLQDGVWNGERILPEGFVKFVSTLAPAWAADKRPIYGGFFWLNGTGTWPVPTTAYYMLGAGGQVVLIVPSHDLVVVRLGFDKGEQASVASLRKALSLLMQAVPSSS